MKLWKYEVKEPELIMVGNYLETLEKKGIISNWFIVSKGFRTKVDTSNEEFTIITIYKPKKKVKNGRQ